MAFLRSILNENHWEKLEKSKRSSKSFRLCTENGLLMGSNIFLSLAIQFETPRWLYILLAISFFLLYLISVYYYSEFDDYIKEKNLKYTNTINDFENKLEKLTKNLNIKETEIKGCEEAFSSIQATIELSAKNLNILRHDLMDDGKASESIWNFNQICALICKNTFSVLVKLYQKQEFEVSYISYKKMPTGEHVSHMLCYETRNNEMPSINNKDIVLNSKVWTNY